MNLLLQSLSVTLQMCFTYLSPPSIANFYGRVPGPLIATLEFREFVYQLPRIFIGEI